MLSDPALNAQYLLALSEGEGSTWHMFQRDGHTVAGPPPGAAAADEEARRAQRGCNSHANRYHAKEHNAEQRAAERRIFAEKQREERLQEEKLQAKKQRMMMRKAEAALAAQREKNAKDLKFFIRSRR